MSSPVTEPGWYRLGVKGFERVADLDDPPEETWDLVRIEFDTPMAEEPLW